MSLAKADLTDCDREPIHIPGTIQPFGVLFVLSEPSLTIAQVSENVGEHLPFGVEQVLGRPLSTMLDTASVAEVKEALDEEFLKGTKAHGMVQLKGHRSVGGMRASIYNAMPIEGVQQLVAYLREFEARHA